MTKHITREQLDWLELDMFAGARDCESLMIRIGYLKKLIYTARAYYTHRMDELTVTGQELEEDMKDD